MMDQFVRWLTRPFRHRHWSPYKELYAPWEGQWEWVYRCPCGHEWRESVDV